jgi:hypothetical protein
MSASARTDNNVTVEQRDATVIFPLSVYWIQQEKWQCQAVERSWSICEGNIETMGTHGLDQELVFLGST